jgi:beta-glucosidase
MKKTFFILTAFLLFLLVPLLSAQIFPYQDSTLSVDQRVTDLINRMTLDEKIGQMMQVDLGIAQYNPSILTNYFIGSVLSGGGSDPSTGNLPLNWANAYDMLQAYSLNTRLKIPMIYGIDAVHGHNNVYGATIFPHNIGMGCTRNPALAKKAARLTAIEVAATGIDWTFGPCIAVPRDERWGRTYEGFGETPELAQLLGSSEIRGFQGDSLSDPTSILACAKHYLGDGGTTSGIDQGNTQGDTAAIRNLFLPGYISAVDSGVGSIMVSFSSINGFKMHGSKYWVTDVLKNELGFKGFIVSDWAAIDQLTSNYKDCVEQSINAGIDMVMLPNRYDDFRTDMRSLIDEGRIDTARVDDAVKRILTIKFKLGLFERPFTDRSLLPLIGCTAHREVARQCVRESIVLLKKKDGILPLRKTNARILVAGSNADNLGNQCGGWTISWQGISGNITRGTTILQGMRKIAATNATIEYSKTGTFTSTPADYSVVVIGETPYAEYFGDRTDLSISKTDVDLVKKMKGYGAPVIVILVSGRPLILEKILHFSDVIIAAWLPGTEGDGVAEVLFGDYQPKGRLSHTWPKSMSQIPINFGDTSYSPLYEYGFGIDTLADSPTGSPPVCLSAIITPDAKHFELTFNKRMKDPSSAQATFVLTRNQFPFVVTTTPLLKQTDSTTIIVELDTTYYSSSDLSTIMYSSGTIKSADEGALQPFAPMDAYNWIGSSAVVKEDNKSIPLVCKLDQNYPNPFNPTTVISYQLLIHGYTTLKVYDVLGREVATLIDGEQSTGVHSISWDASHLSSGVFFYRLRVGDFNDVKKMMFIK